MALSASTTWEVRTTGASTAGGGFNVGNTNMAADLAATVASGPSPVVTSASYSFVAGDVGALLFISSGTNWVPGWYPIASVSAGAATLTASAGSVQLYGGTTLVNTTTGCASTASPTGAAWTVDYSQQAAAQLAFTDLVIGGNTSQVIVGNTSQVVGGNTPHGNGDNTSQLTSSANPFGANCVGNLLNITSGTGFVPGWYEVVSVSTAIATMDRSVGTAASTGGGGNLGGCLDGFATVASAMVAANKAFIKGGVTYTTTSAITFAQSQITETNAALPSRLIGYSTSRGDGGKATLQLQTTTSLVVLTFGGLGWLAENLVVDCNSLAGTTGISLTGGSSQVENCKVANFGVRGITVPSTNNSIGNCEVTGGLNGATAAVDISAFPGLIVNGCNVHDNQCVGILGTNTSRIIASLITNNSGSISDGIQCGWGATIRNNTIHGSGRHGVLANASAYVGQEYQGNILSQNGGYGIKLDTLSGLPAFRFNDGNAYYGNTLGTRSNMDDAGAVNPENGVAPYINTRDVILTVDPYVSPSNNDYRLNNVAGGGAACRGHGVPSCWGGNLLTTSSADLGAVQHADLTNVYRGRRGT